MKQILDSNWSVEELKKAIDKALKDGEWGKLKKTTSYDCYAVMVELDEDNLAKIIIHKKDEKNLNDYVR